MGSTIALCFLHPPGDPLWVTATIAAVVIVLLVHWPPGERLPADRRLVLLATPAVLFVVLNVVQALDVMPFVDRVHRRVALLYSGQPGATTLLASALAGLVAVVGGAVEVNTSPEGGVIYRTKNGAVPIAVGGIAMLAAFVAFYLGEYLC